MTSLSDLFKDMDEIAARIIDAATSGDEDNMKADGLDLAEIYQEVRNRTKRFGT